MSVDISRIAELAKLYFPPGELLEIEKDMASIIELMDSLRDVDLPEGEDEFESQIQLSALRGDAAGESLPRNVIVSQSPEGGDFRLPRVIE